MRRYDQGWDSLSEPAGPRPKAVPAAWRAQPRCSARRPERQLAVLNRLGGASGDRTVAAMASAAARLLRAYVTQVEALRRLRNGGSQTVRVEHVHVNEGGQALIGNVSSER